MSNMGQNDPQTSQHGAQGAQNSGANAPSNPKDGIGNLDLPLSATKVPDIKNGGRVSYMEPQT